MKHVLLLIDDDEDMLGMMSAVCRKTLPETQVLTALNGMQGLELAQAHKPGVVVLDVVLPDLNGFEVCRRMRADPATANTHILMISGIMMEAKDRIHGIESGADNYLFKPFEPEELILQIKALFRWWDAEQAHLEKMEALVAQRTNELARTIAVLEKEITERKQTELELAREQNLLNSLITTSPDHIYFKDRASRFIRINATQAQIFGLRDPRDAAGKSDADFFGPEHAKQTYADEQQLMATGQALMGVEEKETWPDGHVTWVSTTKVALREPTGDIIGLVGISRDITAHKQAEAENLRLAMAVEQAAESIVITDLQGTILYVNPAFEKSSGYTRQEALGQNPRLLKSGNQEAAFYQPLWATLLRGEVWHGHFCNKRKDGTLYEEEATISPIHNAAGTITNYVAIKLDVTRERQLEEQVQHAQKMESVGRLAGGVAHDFNNILQAILGYTEVLLNDVPETDDKHTDLLEIQKSASRAADLTRQLLAYSRRQMISLVPVHLNTVVGDTQKMLHRLLGEDIQIATSLAPNLPRILADAGQLQQILMNLAINARDAMPHGGRLTINTGRVVFDEQDAGIITDARSGCFVCLAVTDTGVGMSKAVMAHIFEPFFSTKGLGKGTGLGLSVIYGIAQQHNGWINVYSQEGHGSTFKLYLPACADDVVEPSALPAAPGSPPRGHGERILLIEDEPEVRNLAVRVLRAAGYEVHAAGQAKDGAALFAENKERFDLLFSDVVLPDQSGIALAEQLQKQKPDLPVLLCSGYTDERARWTDIKQQRFRFLQKPYPAAELLQTVHAILNAHPAPSA